ncbi:MAG: fibrillarin-like rRNA/tRNA 2'-O-methyltransferase [Methanosarcinaceae archaeon]|nr:fibrillarin-like rRNA/tRNA 2'-O-methyltransferase [Methanosarcinaceae archaeon]
MKKISHNISKITIGSNSYLATLNAVPKKRVYGENLFKINSNTEYRIWNIRRSKIGAMLIKKFNLPFKKDSKILYIGAASGTTVSHLSDIVTDGVIYAVEFSNRPMRDLLKLSKMRPNIIPILADASKVDSFAHIVETVDIVFQDIAQSNQAEIAAKSVKRFLKKDGILILSIKARSINAVEIPRKVYESEISKLKNDFGINFKILKKCELAPFHKDHIGIVAEIKIDK